MHNTYQSHKQRFESEKVTPSENGIHTMVEVACRPLLTAVGGSEYDSRAGRGVNAAIGQRLGHRFDTCQGQVSRRTANQTGISKIRVGESQ